LRFDDHDPTSRRQQPLGLTLPLTIAVLAAKLIE